MPAASRSRSRREHAGQRVGHRVAGEQRAAREHLEQHDAERPDVGPLVDREPFRLLGRHVRRRAEDDPELRAVHRGQRRRLHQRRRAREIRRRRRRPGGGIHRLRQSEVEDFDSSFDGSFDVLRFEVSVDDPFLVCFLESLGDL
jgi:hypothetical protein